MTYRFRSTTGCFNRQAVTADVAGRELDRIYQQRGTLQPAEVVNEARPTEAPLHPAFEWDDSIAGERWRENQARHLIRTVVVVTEDHEAEEVEETVYVGVRGESTFAHARDVVNDEDMFESAWNHTVEQLHLAQRGLDQLMRIARQERRPDPDRYGKALRLLQRVEVVMLRGE